MIYEYLPWTREIREPNGKVRVLVLVGESCHEAWVRTFGRSGPGPHGEIEVPDVYQIDQGTRERTNNLTRY